jgi:hypothetical protein
MTACPKTSTRSSPACDQQRCLASLSLHGVWLSPPHCWPVAHTLNHSCLPIGGVASGKANMMKWKEQLNGDCPKRDAHSMHERCDLVCPDLPKVL